MPLEDKEQILNDIFKKVKESSSTIKSLFSMEKKQQKVSSNVIAQQEEKNSEEEVSRDEEKQYRIKNCKNYWKKLEIIRVAKLVVLVEEDWVVFWVVFLVVLVD